MEKKKTFEPGQLVVTITGQVGMVVSENDLPAVRDGTLLLDVVTIPTT